MYTCTYTSPGNRVEGLHGGQSCYLILQTVKEYRKTHRKLILQIRTKVTHNLTPMGGRGDTG